MPVWMYDTAGQPFEVPEEQVQQAWAAGFGFAEGAEIPIDYGDGRYGKVAPHQLDEALAYGGRVEGADASARRAEAVEYGTAGQALVAGLEATASSASLGITDVLGATLSPEWAEESAKRRRHSPTATVAGEVAGFLTPFAAAKALKYGAKGVGLAAKATQAAGAAGRVVSAPTAAAMRFGGAVERVAGGGVRGMAARGAAEGALAGAGQGLSEAALAPGGIDYDHLAERVASGAKSGALFGGAVGGAVGAVGAGLGAGLQRAGVLRRPGVGAGVADDAVTAAAAADATADMTASVSRGGAGVEIGEGVQTLAKKIRYEQTLAAIGVKPSQLAKLGKTVKEVEASAKRIAADLREAGIVKRGSVVGEPLEAIATAKAAVGKELGDFRRAASDWIEASPDPSKFRERISPASLMAELDEQVLAKYGAKPLSRAADGAPAPDLSRAVFSTERQIGAKARRELSVLQQLEAKPGGATLAEMQDLRERLDRVIRPQLGRNAKGLPPPPPPHAAALEEARAIIERRIVETTEAAAAEMGSKMAGELRNLKRRYRSFAEAEAMAAPAAIGSLAGQSSTTAERLATGALGVGGAVVGAIAGGGIGAMAGLAGAAAGGAVLRAVRARAPSLIAHAADAVVEHSARVARGVDRAVRLASPAPARVAAVVAADRALRRRKGESRGDAYRRRLAELQLAAANPEILGQRVRALGEVAPRTAAALAAKSARDTEYLLRVAPRGLEPDPSDPTPHLRTIEPDPVAMLAWARKLEVVEDPLAVVDHVERGTLTRDHVEALQATSPRIYGEIQAEVVAALDRRTRPLPLATATQIGVLFGVPTTPLLRPSSLAATASVFGGGGGSAPDATRGPAKPVNAARVGRAAEAIAAAAGTESERVLEGIA